MFPEKFVKPKVLMSQCLNFDRCRHDGGIIQEAHLEILENHFDLATICPEVMIGLGTPRASIRVVQSAKDAPERLLQPATGKDVTSDFEKFATTLAPLLSEMDGAILKSRSPSCGIYGIKRYHRMEENQWSMTGPGLFPKMLKELCPDLVLEEEGRLRSLPIRRHFLTRLYLMQEFRGVMASRKPKELVQFHARHKYMLLVYNQAQMRKMGKLVANWKDIGIEAALETYREHLKLALAKIPRDRAHHNILEHALGYFKGQISLGEKHHFLDLVRKATLEQVIPIEIPIEILKSWMIRFNEEYLASQSYFSPFPVGLPGTTDSSKGR